MHPLFFPKLLMFMKMKCLSCHDFRLGKRQTRIFCAKLHLIDVGRVNEALELDGLLASASMNAGAGQFAKSTTSGRTSSSSSTRQAQNDAVSAGGNAIDDILNDKLSVGPPSSSTSSNNGSLTTHERSARRHILKQFQGACTKCIKCANCQAFSPKVRHDQFNKMFQIPLGSKGKKSNIGNRVRIRSACSIVGSGLYTGDDDGEEEDVWPDSEDEVMDDVDEVESSEEEEEDNNNNNNEHHHDENILGTNVSLLPINPHVSTLSSGDDDIDEHDHHFNSASEWLKLHLPSTENNDDIDKKKMKKKYNKYSTNIQPKVSCGVTHTSFVIPKEGTAAVGNGGGEAYLVGTIFGRTYQKLTIQPTRLPLKIIRISSGRRHVLALTEGSATSPSFGSSGGGGGVPRSSEGADAPKVHVGGWLSGGGDWASS